RQGVKALIVTPTRELALQISEVINGASKRTHHRTAVIYGGMSMGPQISKLRRGVDIIVACPGRLLDLHARGAVDLSKVETLVLDEADRMLDMGFWPDVKRILSLLPGSHQTLLFSATMDPQVVKIVDSILSNPVRIEVSPPTHPVERVAQSLYPVARAQKTDLLVKMLAEGSHSRTLVFTRTKHRADRLAQQLSRAGVRSSAIHGGRSQSQRQTALDGFKRGRHDVLVATDVASRGIDVNEISHVVNYDMPNTAEDYVHRIGRTARAGTTGTAISFLDETEHEVLRDIEKVLGVPLACEDIEGFDYHPARIVPNPERTAIPAGKPRKTGGSGGRRRSTGGSGAGSGAGRSSSSGNGGSTGGAGSSNGGGSSSGGGSYGGGSGGNGAGEAPRRSRRAGRRGGKGRAGGTSSGGSHS
ncbi:MAG TPA: DEAD/DEAH box helicase, partial [Coriobacteriia bacterium]|nr:DEAD/DEAH box helicase [Coriobacteriia bacterium]